MENIDPNGQVSWILLTLPLNDLTTQTKTKAL